MTRASICIDPWLKVDSCLLPRKLIPANNLGIAFPKT
jgi:hypothetical protein